LINDVPFGGMLSSNIKIGALVSWTEWMIIDNSLIEEIHYGTVVEKISTIQGGRPICIIKVACSKTGEVLSLNPFQLRLKETN
jgi:hypothetical protein